jgi:ParB family chromosome partitioning protein
MKPNGKRKALGRGVARLRPTAPEEPAAGGGGGGDIQDVDINAIVANPFQPRVDFDEEEIAGLAESIKNQGLLQPVVLRLHGDRYQIISGERRVRAFRFLKRESVPCVVKEMVTDREMLELALVENIQREQLNEIEKAAAYKKLIMEFGYTHEDLAKQVGKSRAAVTNSMRLLNLPEEVQQMLRRDELSMGHARALLSLESEEKQIEAARQILGEKLTVRDVEGAVKRKKREAKPEEPQDPNIAHQLERLQYKFGTPVKIKITGNNRGRLEIEYFNGEDLVRVFDLLLDGGTA